MVQLVSSTSPFSKISWWAKVVAAPNIMFDLGEHFEKMSMRNRYRISGANNSILLTIPLENGRDQRLSMKNVKICNREKWQLRHWRTLVSVYRRSPFWEYYEPTLLPLFEAEFNYLLDFNFASFHFLTGVLHLDCELTITNDYIIKTSENQIDIRDFKNTPNEYSFPLYYQIFEDKIGFQPNLSILDLLFSEGPLTLKWLLANRSYFVNS